MAYSEKVIDHYNNPRNMGSLPKEDKSVGTGIVGAPECGDVMKLQIKVENDRIVDAKFKTFGCGSAIASSSLATEWLKGRTVDEAYKIKNTDIVQELNLPPVKIHCSCWPRTPSRPRWKTTRRKRQPARRKARKRSHRQSKGKDAFYGRHRLSHSDCDVNPERHQGGQAPPRGAGVGQRRAAPWRERWGLLGSQLHCKLRYGDGALRSVLRDRRHPHHRGHEKRDLSAGHPARLSEGFGERPVQVQQPERRQELRLRRIVLRLTIPPKGIAHTGHGQLGGHAPCVSRARRRAVWKASRKSSPWHEACAGTVNPTSAASISAANA